MSFSTDCVTKPSAPPMPPGGPHEEQNFQNLEQARATALLRRPQELQEEERATRSERFSLFITAFAVTLFTCGLALINTNVQHMWNSVFTGRKLVHIPLVDTRGNRNRVTSTALTIFYRGAPQENDLFRDDCIVWVDQNDQRHLGQFKANDINSIVMRRIQVKDQSLLMGALGTSMGIDDDEEEVVPKASIKKYGTIAPMLYGRLLKSTLFYDMRTVPGGERASDLRDKVDTWVSRRISPFS